MKKQKLTFKTLPLLPIIILFLCFSCSEQHEPDVEKDYLRWVGDSEYNTKMDNENFKTCNGEDNVLQYFNLGEGPVYPGEKPALVSIFESQYKPVTDKNQNGLIRIRFVVNCEGRAGRFRLLQADAEYKETKFDKKIISQLTEITKGIKEWVVLYDDSDEAVDYYYYLIFKIADGRITEILP